MQSPACSVRQLTAVSLAALVFLFCGLSLKAAPKDGEWQPILRRLPPKGVDLPEPVLQDLHKSLDELHARIERFRTASPDRLALLPDVLIFEKAVRYALLHGEFFKPEQAKVAQAALQTAGQRLDALEKNEHPWTAQRTPVAMGYVSEIDGSPQPYGLEIPADLDLAKPAPLYVWLHGRGEQATDLYFIEERQSRHGQIETKDGIVLHPFGRQCIGYKSAGEMDVLEAIASVQQRFKIDPNRIVLMGFSMGGAGAWQIGAHCADQFAAMHAGAGFVDVVKFQNIQPADFPPAYTQTLWGVYDVPNYVRNLFNLPVVNYGGEIDKQRQAGDIMAEAFKQEGRELKQFVGPGMGHKYDPASLEEIMRLMKSAADKGRDIYPKQVTLQTRTLRYNTLFWISATSLEHHWQDSRLDATVDAPDRLTIKSKNVNGIAITRPWATPPANEATVHVVIDGQSIDLPAGDVLAGKATFAKKNDRWQRDDGAAKSPRKVHGLQGPIDDVVMAPFLVVKPSGRCAHPAVQRWVDFELAHFESRWREVFRGDLRIKADTDVTADDIAKYNLILWGDASSNSVMAKVLTSLPIKWSGASLDAGGKTFDAATHVPLMIYPNPLNPSRCISLNSGPTFREDDDRTNSQQNPKLGDWAIVDVTAAPDEKSPGRIEDAGFFDESWQFTSSN